MSFQLAKLRGQSIPPARELPVAAGAAFLRGALLVQDANGAWAECGADPAAIGGVAESDYAVDSAGYGGHGRSEFPPGYMQATSPANEIVFSALYTGTLPAADGGSYGVVRDADSQWKVDFSDTTATRVKLVGRRTGSPENIPRVLVTFLAANVQIVQ